MTSQDFKIRFWGVRGSLPVPGPTAVYFGGNTPCVEIRCGASVLIFDAGTGIFPLGRRLVDQSARQVELFLSHYHSDHIEGLPFFEPLHRRDFKVRVWAGNRPHGLTVKQMLDQFMNPPFFPVTVEAFASKREFHDFTPGEDLQPAPGVLIATMLLNHPDACTGYRVFYRNRSVCYITDTEHRPGLADISLTKFIRGADIVIYDAMYDDSEFRRYQGFGHSTWQEGIRLCEKAKARRLILFHHSPSKTDNDLERLERKIEAARPGTLIAREGLEIML